jgi:ABC-2 type transport system permease protein
MIVMVPIVQLLVLTYAVTFELKNVRMFVVDNDLSETSRRLVSKFEGSPFYEITGCSFGMQDAEDKLLANETDIILNIPAGFERDLYRGTPKKLQFIVNAINSNVAALTLAYSSMVLADYNSNLAAEMSGITQSARFKNITTTYSYWYNSEMDYKIYMAPGILVMIVTTIGLFLSGMNIVREKEIGTIEQINVTPIVKSQFIIGKLAPFLIIGIIDLFLGMLVAKLLFSIPIAGNILVVLSFAFVYLFTLLGLGLLISTLVNTQQQALFMTWFFLVVFILMSGLFTPIESMPKWAQYLDYLNPVAYFIRVMRMVLMKGSGFADVAQDFIMLGTYGILVFAAAVRRYRKTT